MNNIYRIAAFLALAVVAVSALALAQTYAGDVATPASGAEVSGGSISVGGGSTQSFSLGTGYMYSMMSIGPDEAARLRSAGVRTITVQAGSMVHITAQTGQPMSVKAGPGETPNMIVFGPGGLSGIGVWTGPGTGAYAGAGGAGAGASAGAGGVGTGAYAGTGGTGGTGLYAGTGGTGGTGLYAGTGGTGGTGLYAGTGGTGGTGLYVGAGGVGAGASAGAGGVGVGMGTGTIVTPGGAMQMYSFTGSPGQAFLITQQSGGTMDKVLVIFQ